MNTVRNYKSCYTNHITTDSHGRIFITYTKLHIESLTSDF